jgi:hypothetical protein
MLLLAQVDANEALADGFLEQVCALDAPDTRDAPDAPDAPDLPYPEMPERWPQRVRARA